MKCQPKNLQDSILMLLIRWQRSRNQDGGYILVVAIAMVLILSSLLVTYALMSKVDTSSGSASAKSNTGFYAAEAGLNLRAKQVKNKFEGYNRPSGTSPTSWQSCTDTSTTNNGSSDFACANSTFQNQAVSTLVQEDPANPNFITIPPGDPFAGLSAQEYRFDVTSVATDSENLPTAILGMRFKSRLVPLFQFVAFYKDDLDFAIPPNMTLNGPVHTNGNLYFDASGTLTINGQVSTAGTLYRGNKVTNTCSGTVRIYDPTTARALNCVGSTRTSYNQSGVSAWNNQIRVGISPLTIPTPDTFDPTPGKLYWDKADLRIALKLDGSGNPIGVEVRNQNNSVNSTATPNLLNGCSLSNTILPNTTLQNEGSGDPAYETTDTVLKVSSAAGFNIGDVVIVGTDFDSNVVSARNTTATPNTITLKRQLGHSSYQTGAVASAGATVREAIVSTSDTFYNYREKSGVSGAKDNAGKFIRMINVDVQGLLNCAHSQNLMGKALNDDTEGGLVWFLTVDGPNSITDVNNSGSPNNYGVRVYNGSELVSTVSGAPAIVGLTIVSDQAVYVRGDYNLTNKKPASFLGDTINVLSNAWSMDDSYSRLYDASSLPYPSSNSAGKTDVDNRNASATTINAAFLGGNDISGDVNGTAGEGGGWSTSGGGLNNYPRFQEDWAGINFNYRGSFVSLNRSRRVDGPWCGSQSIDSTCNTYNPPFRNWDFDTDFNNAANLPPLSPRAVYLRQELFERTFDRAAVNLLSPNPVTMLPPNFLGLLHPLPNKLFSF